MLHVHLSAVLFGGTALFAKWITLPPAVTTFWRTVVALLVVWLVLLFYQLIGICLLFFFAGLTADPEPVLENAGRLLLLGVFFTALPHFLMLSSLRALEAKTVLIVSSLMLPYSMIFGAVLLDEIPAPRTLIGCVLVLAAATIENLRARKPTSD